MLVMLDIGEDIVVILVVTVLEMLVEVLVKMVIWMKMVQLVLTVMKHWIRSNIGTGDPIYFLKMLSIIWGSEDVSLEGDVCEVLVVVVVIVAVMLVVILVVEVFLMVEVKVMVKLVIMCLLPML